MAQQGARANAGICHESCCFGLRNDFVTKGTPRARSRRGSSLTLAGKGSDEQFTRRFEQFACSESGAIRGSLG